MKHTLKLSTVVLALLLAFQNCSMNGFEALSDAGSFNLFSSSAAKTKCEEKAGSEKQNCFAVTKLYHDYLKRDPGFDDLNEWSSIITRGEMTLNKVSQIISTSTEAKALAQKSTSRSILWGAWIDGIPTEAGHSFQSRAQFNQMAGKNMSLAGIVTWWYTDQSWSNFNDLYNTPSDPNRNWANIVHDEGAMPVLMWQMYQPTDLSCETSAYINHIKKFSSKNIARGDHDNYIRTWARQIKSWGKPIYMRTMHELNFKRVINNPCTEYFTSWDADLTIKGEVINTPADSIAAWKRAVDIFRSEGAHNVKWIWSVLSAPSANYGGGNSVSLASIYPGDAYVDWIGIECYNFKTEGDWAGCSDRMSEIYAEAAALSPVLPIMNVEMGAFEDSRKASWLREALDINNPQAMVNRYPRLSAFMYWNDSRYYGLWIKSSQASINSFQSTIQHPVYLSNSNLSNQSCIVDGVQLTSGQNQLFYKSRTANNCNAISQNRKCNVGKLDGSHDYAFSSCTVVLDEATAKQMVVDVFTNILGRTSSETVADTTGVAFWIGQLRQGISEQEFKNMILDSDEHYLRTLYKNIFKRNSQLSEIKYYLNELSAKRMTRASIAQHFNYTCNNKLNGECGGNTGSPDPNPPQTNYTNIVIGGMINTLGRTMAEAQGDTAGINYWVQRLQSGYPTSSMATDMRNSDEYFVRQAYITILKRRPQMSEVQYYMNEISAKRMSRSSVTQHLQYVCTNKIGGECK